MHSEHIQRLLMRFNSGTADDADRREVEALLEADVISLEDLQSLSALEEQISGLRLPDPSPSLDRNFYAMLASETSRKAPYSWKQFFSWEQFAPKFALATVALFAGLAAGYFLRGPAHTTDTQIVDLTRQVSNLQEMMMLSLLEKESATERLKAVSLTQEMGEASRKVTGALIKTLNEDENINVRLAALEALKPYATDSGVREALVRSIARQESPLVQISLAELMVALQEKAAVTEFEKLIESGNIPPEVKTRIREKIETLI